ncbi:MAG: hypothetical protein M1828_003473 [Chrysothrix sp. TS-e1954]|nr:MAG: hypothetical protein M1828_003473 [Chrysothrix sp. TS-e1954]
MTLLDAHLEQIELCSSTISELPFPPPKIFTNAMLNTNDITALIRDTEPHERFLFSLAPATESKPPRDASEVPTRRSTVFNVSSEGGDHTTTFKPPRRGTAVAALLGGSLSERIRHEYGREVQDTRGERRNQKDDIDVELLLKGAEKLCSVYQMPGVLEKIATLRVRNAKAMASMEKYEDLVAEQNLQLGKMNRSTSFTADEEELDDYTTAKVGVPPSGVSDLPLTVGDVKKEEEDVAELERKKRVLEERVTGMEKDLGGLMR